MKEVCEAKYGGLLLLACHSFSGATTSSCVGASALASYRETHAMATTTNTTYILKTLQGHAFLTTQITFDGEILGCSTELLDVSILEILDPDVGVHPRFGQDGFGPCEANSIDICEGHFNPLITGDVNAGDPCHGGSIKRDIRPPVCRRQWTAADETLWIDQLLKTTLGVSPDVACAWGWCRSP